MLGWFFVCADDRDGGRFFRRDGNGSADARTVLQLFWCRWNGSSGMRTVVMMVTLLLVFGSAGLRM